MCGLGHEIIFTDGGLISGTADRGRTRENL